MGDVAVSKKWYQSLTVWGAIVAVASAVLTAAVGAIDQQFGTNLASASVVTNIVSALGGIAAIIGRLTATTKIG